MPGWYIHMDAARKAIDGLAGNNSAKQFFANKGPSAKALADIAHRNPAYLALGAIGPDIFFILPDFMGGGAGLYPVAQTIRDLYEWWDTNFVGPYEEQLERVGNQNADQIAAITGDLSKQVSAISAEAIGFLKDVVVTLMVRQYDLFGLLGSGVQRAYDESSFYWSDMLHYRRTSHFAGRLWQLAEQESSPWKERFQAFALGWMSHVATDVTGHAFVNEKCGGPYRLHWQRHHLVENHMDALVYKTEHGTSSHYQMLSSAALHLWIAFDETTGASRVNCFVPLETQANLSYPLGDTANELKDRKTILDQDSELPKELATFIRNTLLDVYKEASPTGQSATGQWKASPMNLSDIVPGVDRDGFPSADDIVTTYWWLYKYAKLTTTDFFKLRRPDPPPVVYVQPLPTPPTGPDSGAGSASGDFPDAFETFLDILAWLDYIGEVVLYPATVLAGIVASAGSYPARALLYELIEIPLYNAWMAIHWQLSMTGFTLPMQSEINMGLNTLGASVSDSWTGVLAALQTLDGGLNASAANTGSEPSGFKNPQLAMLTDQKLSLDVVTDPPSWLQNLINQGLQEPWSSTEAPSEFLRPWKFPLKNNSGTAVVPSELPSTPTSPFTAGQDATILMKDAPGNNSVRDQLERSRTPEDTARIAAKFLPSKHLGDPVDFTAYVIARLTRAETDPKRVPNFNLDADRGYGFLAWDWTRSNDIQAVPLAFQNTSKAAAHTYNAPLAPGTGWNAADLLTKGSGIKPHDDKTAPVAVRYLDKQNK